jgi:hypothetical protein
MIAGRTKMLMVALAASTGGPYVATIVTKPSQPSAEHASLDTAAAGGHADAAAPLTIDGQPLAGFTPGLPLEGAPVTDLAEIFRFDVSSGWVLGRWARVFTCPPEADLRGYRVPLVTGTAETDLAGSLTYYFDRQQRVRRITFIGTTGDTQPLVKLVTERYELLRQVAGDPGLHIYQLKRDGRAVSELRLQPAAVVMASRPRARFDVQLWLERPEDKFQMFSPASTDYISRGW